MPTYRCEGRVNHDGTIYQHGSPIELAAGPVRDKLLFVGAIWRPDLRPYVFRDRGEMKLVPADGTGVNRPVFGQVANGRYAEFMKSVGAPMTEEGRRYVAERWSGMLQAPDFTQVWLEPVLRPLDPGMWPAQPGSWNHWVWVPRSFGTGLPACAELPIY